MWLNLLLSFGLVAFAAASPSSKDKPTFRKCDNYTGEQAVTITSFSMDPYPIKFDCEGSSGDHLYCGPPYQMTTSLKVDKAIPKNSILELVLKKNISSPLGSVFLPIPCIEELPPLPSFSPRPPRPTTGPSTTTTTGSTTTGPTTTTTPWTIPIIPCSFDFDTIFCDSKHTTAPWCESEQGYPVPEGNYTINSSFDVPWLIALFPGQATDILVGSYELDFRVKPPGESEPISCSTIGISIVDPNPPKTTTAGSKTSTTTETPPDNAGIPAFSPAIIFTLICAFFVSM